MRFQLTAQVDPETAFARVADFAELEVWDPFVKRSVLEAGEAMAVGAVYRLESLGGVTLRYRIVEVARPHVIVYQGGTDRVVSTDSIEVSAATGGSRVTVTSELSFEGRMRPLAPLISTLVWLGGRYGAFPALEKHLAASG